VAAGSAIQLTLHLPGALNFDRPRSIVIFGVFVVGGVFFDDVNEVFAVEHTSDGNEGVGLCQIGDETECGVSELGDGSVEFSEAIRTVASLTDY
jgi:hypothetical protein